MGEPRADTYATLENELALVAAELAPLRRALRITEAEDEYLDLWAEEYQHVRGRGEADFVLRIRLFNALDTIRNWGAKPGITEWIGGLLRVGPIYEEAFRGHWAWFSGAQAVGHDSYVSDPFLWDMWLWKTTATDKWADKLYTAWIELMKPLKTNVTIRLPADPAMLRGFGQAPELAQ